MMARPLALVAMTLLGLAPAGAALATTPPTDPAAPGTPTTIAGPAVPGGGRASWTDFATRYRGDPADSTTGTGTGVAADVTTSPDGSYTLRYPAEPVATTQQVPLPTGAVLPVELLQLQTTDALYQSAYAEYPPGVATDVDVEVDSFMQSAQATLVSSEPIERAGRQGVLFTGERSGGDATVVGLAFVDGRQLWLVTTAGPGDLTPEDPDVKAFLDSFQFTEGG